MFTAQLSNCNCCPRKCGVNRIEEKTSFCGVGADIQIAHIGLHHGEEPPISGTKGSGTIFFAGCNLHCVFCQNYQISQEFKKSQMQSYSVEELAEAMLKLQHHGAHNINFVSPSHMIYQMADAIVLAKKQGLSLPVVYNSNAYDSVDALKEIKGLVDIFLPDLKYMDNLLGKSYSNVKDYVEVVPAVIAEMYNQVGHLVLDSNGIATKGILVRHLVLPGSLDNSKKCLDFLSDFSPDIYVSLLSQYTPLYKAHHFPEINRSLRIDEYDEIMDYALSVGLENVFIQDLESNDLGIPDFNLKSPFVFQK